MMTKVVKYKYVILGAGVLFAVLDSTMTNWIVARGGSEMNPLMIPFAGTWWLYVVKVGWIILFLPILLILDKRG